MKRPKSLWISMNPAWTWVCWAAITTIVYYSSKKLLVAPGITTRNKNLLVTRSIIYYLEDMLGSKWPIRSLDCRRMLPDVRIRRASSIPPA